MRLQSASHHGPTRLDALICAYLALPLLVFSFWFIWPAALVLALLTAHGGRLALAGTRRGAPGVSLPVLVLVTAVALAWTALSGVGHFVFANLDWTIRDAVLRDLSETPWPPMYDQVDGVPRILRAPLGFYLPVAALGPLVGLAGADLLLYLWTAVGFALVLGAAMSLFDSARERLLCVALLLLFGGLDMVGFQFLRGYTPALGQHVEWWAGFAQYSSQSTLLFWTPNHALPAWLGLLLALRHWRAPLLARMAPLLAAAITLWSPLATLGLLPFFVLGIDWRRDIGALLRGALVFAVPAALVACYVTLDAQHLARGWSADQFANSGEFWLRYASFFLLEFGVLAMLLAGMGAVDIKVAVAVGVLLALPLWHFGGSNDLTMRSGIPSLTLLALASVRPLAGSDRLLLRGMLAVVLGVGAMGSLQEPLRAALTPRWALTGQSLAQVSLSPNAPFGLTQLPTNYVARLNRPLLQWLLRAPSEVRPGPAPR